MCAGAHFEGEAREMEWQSKYKEAEAPIMNTPPKLPEGWCWVTLNQIGKWSGGGTPSTENSSYWINGTIPWISPKDMKCLKIHESEEKSQTLLLKIHPQILFSGFNSICCTKWNTETNSSCGAYYGGCSC